MINIYKDKKNTLQINKAEKPGGGEKIWPLYRTLYPVLSYSIYHGTFKRECFAYDDVFDPHSGLSLRGMTFKKLEYVAARPLEDGRICKVPVIISS